MFTVDNIAPANIQRGGRRKSEVRIHIENMNPGEWLHTPLKANGKNGKQNLANVRRTVQSIRKSNKDMKFSVVTSDDHNIHVNRVK